MTKKQITSLLLLGAAVVYDFIPVDMIPDIPFIGLLDDLLLTSSAAMNCFQQFFPNSDDATLTIMKWLKWILLIVAALIVIVFLLLAGTIASFIS